MFLEVHSALRRVLYNEGKIDPQAVMIAFESPTTRFLTTLTGPALLFALYEISENTDLTGSRFQYEKDRGRPDMQRWKAAMRRFNLKYMVTAVAADPIDEQRLLARALTVLLRYPKLSATGILAESSTSKNGDDIPTAENRTLISGMLEPAKDSPRVLDIWSAYGAEPRPAFLYTAITSLDLEKALLIDVTYSEWEQYQEDAEALPPAVRQRIEMMTPWERQQFAASWVKPFLHAASGGVKGMTDASSSKAGADTSPSSTPRICLAGRLMNRRREPLVGWAVKIRNRKRMVVTQKDGRFRFPIYPMSLEDTISLIFLPPGIDLGDDKSPPPEAHVRDVNLRPDSFSLYFIRLDID